ncbi:hypothetical protein HYR99_10915 [Candidatus Poribacteria bacterium]|nr:hypothetical protein [Candidatus Poribacteria bacterium]
MPKGFIPDTLALINLIQDNLQDRYRKGFPIIKELIQNAEDAKATCLHIGWTQGFPEIDHPLLQGPALFVLNDGEFKDKDAKAIRKFGISYKGNEQSVIGKFGLGLKSIFHWCEAFFYLGSTIETLEILNPWSGDDDFNFHQDWDEIEPIANKACQSMIYRLGNLLNTSHWFCLWIPLRRQRHCQNWSPINNDFPGDKSPDAVFRQDFDEPIAQILPMLRHLKTVQGWIAPNADGPLTKVFDVTLVELAQRCRFLAIDAGVELPLAGRIRVSGSPSHQYPFGGVEAVPKNEIFQNLKALNSWPISRTRNSVTGLPAEDKNKVRPHCAAYFTEAPATDKGGLSIRWAVFLPMDESEENYSCEGNFDFTLTLHGYFFPDAGRASVEFGDGKLLNEIQDENTLRHEWNRYLAIEGTLPLILPALKQFVQAAHLSAPKIKALTAALQDSARFKADRTHICKRGQWVYLLTPSGMAWQLLDDLNQAIFEIPKPPDSAPNRPIEVFPQLKVLSNLHVITFHEFPRLTLKRPEEWSQELLDLLLDISVEDVFGSKVKLEYLVDFLEDCVETETRFAISETLCRIVREAFNTVELSRLRQNKSDVKAFLGFLPPGERFDIKTDATDSVMRELFKLDVSILLIPKDFAPEEQTTQPRSQLPATDAANILKCLAMQSDADFLKVRTDIALEVIQSSDRETLCFRCGGLKLFKTYDCASQKGGFLSFNELNQNRLAGRLFVYSNPPDKFGLAKQLQQALDGVSIILIVSDIRKTLGWEGEIDSCNEPECLTLLGKKPRLNEPNQRVELLESLLRTLKDPSMDRLALRYLIHGHQQDGNEPLLVERDTADQSVWGKITEQVLRLKGDQWRLIPAVLANKIAPQYRTMLNMTEIIPESVTGLIREIGPEKIDCTTFTVEERNILLRDIKDLTVLRGLRIHEDVNGDPVTITEKSYWEAEEQWWKRVPLQAEISILRNLESSLRWKQEQLLSRLFDAKAAIRWLLKQERPDQYWHVIMDGIKQVEHLADDLANALKSADWLPIDEGRPPSDMIFLKGLEDDVARVMSGLDKLFVEVIMLPDAFRNHPAFDVLANQVFPRTEAALDMLGEIMAEDERYRIGNLDLGTLALGTFCSAFDQALPQLMPARSVIDKVRQVISPDACQRDLLPKLCRELSTDRMVHVLNYLSERHRSASASQKKMLMNVHNEYLTAAVKQSDFAQVLPQIWLLSRQGKWKSPVKLCFDADGIHPDDLLDREQGEIIAPKVKTDESAPALKSQGEETQGEPRRTDFETQFEAGADLLAAYFASWEGTVPQEEVIGGFLCLLGDQSKLTALAMNYLGNRNLESCRERLKWEKVENSRAAGANEDIHESMKKQRFFVEKIDAETFPVLNLLGSSFNAQVNQADFDTLFIGTQFPFVSGANYRVNLMRLRVIQPEAVEPSRLLHLLRESARTLLKRVYKQDVPNLDEVFDDLAQSEQLDIRIAQNLILESALFYLRQLKVDTTDRLREILKKWDGARHRKAEAEHNQNSREKMSAEADLQEAQKALKDLLKIDPETQSILHKAVRRKIEDFQYTPQSVPFELFQNADDAVAEWSEMRGSEKNVGTDATRFVVWQDEEQVSFIHWGRFINQFRPAPFDGREHGYGRDLEKMLVLSASDKSGDNEMVTGKFGLGFKSLFLVTSKPKVVSGRLGFEVVGGLFPQKLTGEPFRNLQSKIDSVRTESRSGTIVTLPIETVSADEILKEFREVAHLLPIFARKIRRCELYSPKRSSQVIAWADRPLLNIQSIQVGQLTPLDDEQNRQMAIVLRAGQGDLLLTLDARKFSRLSKEIPTLWVTAPTNKKLDLGFAINGQFDLDVGRAQLATGSENNNRRADSIGADLGDLLIESFSASKDWAQFCEALNLARDTSSYDFWESLWDLLGVNFQKKVSQSTEEAARLVSRVLWKDRFHGMGKLLFNCPTLPSGLWGDYKALTQADRVRFKAVETLDTEAVFCAVSQWQSFRQQVPIGAIVSDKCVHSMLRNLLGNEVTNCQSLNLRQVLNWEIDASRCVDAPQASRLGAVITPKFLSELKDGTQSQKDEHKNLVEFLKEIQFRGQDGKFHPGSELLINIDNVGNPDEPPRARFAPPDRILASSYTGDALQFFNACRDELSAPAELMAEWAIEASTYEKRLAALKYLLNGELGRELAQEIQGRIYGTWLNQLSQSQLLKHYFDVHNQGILLGLLRLNREEPPPIVWPPPKKVDAKGVLEQIYNWWVNEKETRIQEYEKDVYGALPPKLSDEPEWDNIHTRTDWLLLLTHGSFHTMGRTTLGQHREFLHLCREKGWLQIFADPKIDPTNWMNVLGQFLDQPQVDLKFYHWLRHFVNIFQFARGLDVYGEAFLDIDRFTEPFSLDKITRLKESSDQQGGGLNAPSIDRTLGIGVCFVVREMVRQGVITNLYAYEHCYTPVKRMRKLLSSICCPDLEEHTSSRWERSKIIYDFLSAYLGNRATFDLSFDIPFLIISENKALEQRFFKDTVLQDKDYEEEYE